MGPVRELGVASQLHPSEREVLSVVLRSGLIPRSGVTEKTQLSQQSVHRIIDNLEKRGYLQFGEAQIVGRGKPSPMVSIDPSHFASIGVSVGTEDVRVCLLDLVGNPLIQETVDAEPGVPQEVVGALKAKVFEWSSGPALDRTLLGTGISMQGFRAGTRDIFYAPEPLAAWHDIHLEALLNAELGLPAFAENNATSCAIAEHYLGAANGFGCIAYLSFNYGFGAGIYWENTPFTGGHGNAGEISAVFTEEQTSHRPALGELMKRLVGHGIEVSSVSALARHFDPGWPGVADWLEEVRPQLQLALRAFQATIDPNAIFFGGEAPETLRRMLADVSKGAFTDKRLPGPNLLPSRLPGDPAHLGAALLPLHKLVF